MSCDAAHIVARCLYRQGRPCLYGNPTPHASVSLSLPLCVCARAGGLPTDQVFRVVHEREMQTIMLSSILQSHEPSRADSFAQCFSLDQQTPSALTLG